MIREIKRSLQSSLASAALLAIVSGSALAVDGVILIDQNKALAGNVTPGDPAGFPVNITQPGSYRLSSNLIVPNENTTAIQITASHVTLDLNGFAILGPTNCAGGTLPCAGTGTGNGINTGGSNAPDQFNITIRNGTIQGMGGDGVHLEGDSHLVEYLHVRSNGGNGIFIGSSADQGQSIVQHNTVQRNLQGMLIVHGLIRNNVVNTNGLIGLSLFGSANVSHNMVSRNQVGMNYAPQTRNLIYVGNLFMDNGTDVFANGGHNGGQNVCSGAICP